jgi:NTE family protein
VKADAVFEGGGVKGIAFIGALAEMETRGYVWEKVAGTSAGAIVAALVSAGYRSQDLYEILRKLNYHMFLQRKGWTRIPLLGPVYELLARQGMYPSDQIEQYIDRLLRQKGIRTFGDLPDNKLRILASDITAGRMLILPDDLSEFGIEPTRFPIARAVRMSSCIPYFFQPYLLYRNREPHYIVDGGLLSNFPVWLFDVKGRPRWPTFGFRLTDEQSYAKPFKVKGLLSYSKALLSTMLDAHDRFYVKKAHAVRTVFIPTLGVRITQFDLPTEKRKELYESGRNAACEFLRTWDFENYIKEFRFCK